MKIVKCKINGCGADIFYITMISGKIMKVEAEPLKRVVRRNMGRGELLDTYEPHRKNCPSVKNSGKKNEQS